MEVTEVTFSSLSTLRLRLYHRHTRYFSALFASLSHVPTTCCGVLTTCRKVPTLRSWIFQTSRTKTLLHTDTHEPTIISSAIYFYYLHFIQVLCHMWLPHDTICKSGGHIVSPSTCFIHGPRTPCDPYIHMCYSFCVGVRCTTLRPKPNVLSLLCTRSR